MEGVHLKAHVVIVVYCLSALSYKEYVVYLLSTNQFMKYAHKKMVLSPVLLLVPLTAANGQLNGTDTAAISENKPLPYIIKPSQVTKAGTRSRKQ